MALANLLLDITALPEGVEVALGILHMHFYCDRDVGRQHDTRLITLGGNLLRRVDFRKKGDLRGYELHTLIRVCCSASDGEATARDVCVHIREAMEENYLSYRDLHEVLKTLFETHPVTALDTFLLPGMMSNRFLFDVNSGSGAPLENMDSAVLHQWADQNAAARYALLGQAISMFRRQNEDKDKLSSLFLSLLDRAPDKRVFLGDFWVRIHPSSWSGSLADILFRRKAQVLSLRDSAHVDIRQWVDDMLPDLDRCIERERSREREDEGSFE